MYIMARFKIAPKTMFMAVLVYPYSCHTIHTYALYTCIHTHTQLCIFIILSVPVSRKASESVYVLVLPEMHKCVTLMQSLLYPGPLFTKR